ncbi:hypothetical protein GCM10010435_48640 [Winogradskya consettensis]|uniref:Uncharacterized protein n=1 Tax=Winogradskya consettensis TaxID=113560 RepID=A0A919VNS9_9ACTN|nr:hypothetical protein [Actinoplanes consettensis]GIM73089.1 hypothetical protein Aco04nite_33570 [Actinoplanes consettensis]
MAIVLLILGVANFLAVVMLIIYDLTSGVRARYRRARDLDAVHHGVMGMVSVMRHSDLGQDASTGSSGGGGGGHDHGSFGGHDMPESL